MAGNTKIDRSRIDETLAAYREVQSQFDRLRDRLRLAEEKRHTVNRRIYEKVRSEYERELDALRAKMSPLRNEIDSLRAALEDRVKEASATLNAVEEEQAEAAFRHELGEYSGTTIDEKQRNLDTRLTDTRASVEELRQTLAALEAVQNADVPEPKPEDLADEPAPAQTVAAEAPRRPVLRATDLAASAPKPAPPAPPAPKEAPAPRAKEPAPSTAAAEDLFVNPHDWIDEVRHEPVREKSAPSPARRETAPDESPVATARKHQSPPSLVFVTGTHTGQSIPLLPTTLTIGREHDNNIEIKDAEVARYHARILHERGDYVVEDLDSTTGTWVNGTRARRSVLNHGDVIRVGQTELAIDFEWATEEK